MKKKALIQFEPNSSAKLHALCGDLIHSLRDLGIDTIVLPSKSVPQYLSEEPGPALWYSGPTVRFEKPNEILDLMGTGIKVVLQSNQVLGFTPGAVRYANNDLINLDEFAFTVTNVRVWDASGLAFTGERVVPTSPEAKPYMEAHLKTYELFLPFVKGRVLDVACGCGYGSYEVAKHADFVVGVDVAQEAVDYAAAHYPKSNLVFCKASATNLPFPAGHFDVITSVETFEHVEPIFDFIKEVKRVLVPGGRWFFSTPNGDVHYYKPKTMAERRGHHVWHYDAKELVDLLSGFEVKIEQTDYNPQWGNYNALAVYCTKI